MVAILWWALCFIIGCLALLVVLYVARIVLKYMGLPDDIQRIALIIVGLIGLIILIILLMGGAPGPPVWRW